MKEKKKVSRSQINNSQCVLEGIPFVNVGPLMPCWHELMPRASKCPQWFLKVTLQQAAGVPRPWAQLLASVLFLCGYSKRKPEESVRSLALGTHNQERGQEATSIAQLWGPAHSQTSTSSSGHTRDSPGRNLGTVRPPGLRAHKAL